jgi:hypothetical protein
MRAPLALLCVLAALPVLTPMTSAQDAPNPLTTRWTGLVSPTSPHPEYPRPTLVRADWLSLNGPWEWEPAPEGMDTPDCNTFSGTILVPFAVESALSGIGRHEERFWCRRAFDLPESWRGQRVLLHFGAVDWEARVWVNGKFVGEHRGGYDPFSFDITDFLVDGAKQAVMVRVADPTDASTQPRGKQVREPHGIWYTPTTGIWQTVWLEPVAQTSIEAVEVVTDFDAKTATVTVRVRGGQDADLVVAATDNKTRSMVGIEVAKAGESATISLASAFRPWSPEEPNLYGLLVTLTGPDGSADVVESYFGVRKISVGPDGAGVTRILLNNEPLFLHGPLDQGFWPDGLYTAPTDEALKYDLEVTKRLGFNAVRKHVKVEPERWYYWCDTLGLAVIQDMPSGDRYIGPGDPDIERTPESAAVFEAEWEAIINANREHPSIVMWAPFNEGWGQYDTARIAAWTRELDPTRLVDAVSGWADRGVGDVFDWHVYPGPGSPQPEEHRAAFLGEYGGLGLPLEGHTWLDKGNWGYRSYDSPGALTDAYVQLVENMRWLIADPGLSGAIYTQTTDVEVEVNGLMTYDREVIKMDEARVREANLSLYGPAPHLRTVAPCALSEKVTWRYTTDTPGEGWEKPGFDDSAWKAGEGGFGRAGTPGAINGTEWESGDIWIRRSFVLPRMVLENPTLRIHHDEDCEVYINGVLAAELEGYTTGYVFAKISEEARRAMIGGPTVIAIHCRQTGGGQYIDAGIVDLGR